jgi:hypothetical protein
VVADSQRPFAPDPRSDRYARARSPLAACADRSSGSYLQLTPDLAASGGLNPRAASTPKCFRPLEVERIGWSEGTSISQAAAFELPAPTIG